MTDNGTIPVLEAWRALLAATTDAVMVVDHQGRIELFNGAAERLFGYRADELIGRSINALMPEPDRSAHDSYMDRYLRTHEKRIIGIGREVLAQRSDGSTFPVHLSIGEIAGSEPPRFVGQLHDITARRQTLGALQRERDLARQYLQIAQVALMVLDGHNRVVLINRKGCEILRRSEAEIVGIDWFRLAIRDADRDYVAAQISAVRRDPRADAGGHYHEYHIVDEGGAVRLIAWRGVRIDHALGDEGTVLLSGDDITERRLTEDTSRRTADRMNEVSRLASLGEMAGGIAHEINQPLTAISNYAQASYRMLGSGHADIGDVREALQEISNQALRAGEIIRRLRNLIRKQEAQQELTTLDTLLNDVVGFCASDMRLNEVEIAMECDGSLPPLLLDKVQIQQILFNLLRNAIEAVLPNPSGERRIVIRCARDRDSVCVQVHDNGAGVPPEFATRMFTPLQTTKSSGTGLGLAISRSIAEAHQGSLRYLPDMRPGACFELRLPIPHGVSS
jgi:two-component system sensor kinase FixL